MKIELEQTKWRTYKRHINVTFPRSDIGGHYKQRLWSYA